MDYNRLLNEKCLPENLLKVQDWVRGHKVAAFYVGDRTMVKLRTTTGETWITNASSCFLGTDLAKMVRRRFDAEGRRVQLKV